MITKGGGEQEVEIGQGEGYQGEGCSKVKRDWNDILK